MRRNNLPVQMLSSCAADGTMQPLRFRFEDSEHMLHTVHVREVLDTRRVEFVGIEMLCYICKVLADDREKLLELRYTVRTHKWVLFQELS